MFTVKFVTEATSEETQERIELHQCASIRVYSVDPEPVVKGTPPVTESTIHVELVDDQRRDFARFHIGYGRFCWNVAYVLNDKGRTIQTVVPNSPR